jgi:hypothetical protein
MTANAMRSIQSTHQGCMRRKYQLKEQERSEYLDLEQQRHGRKEVLDLMIVIVDALDNEFMLKLEQLNAALRHKHSEHEQDRRNGSPRGHRPWLELRGGLHALSALHDNGESEARTESAQGGKGAEKSTTRISLVCLLQFGQD